MSSHADSDGKFEYDGRLVFNGIYIESGETPYDSKEELLNDLPDFSEGEPGEPGSGFTDLNLRKWAERYDTLPDDVDELLNDVWDIEYKKEQFDLSEDLVDNQGNPVEGYVLDDWSAYVYWYPDEFMILQASKSKLDNLERSLFPTIGRTHFEQSGYVTGDNEQDGHGDGNNGDGNGDNGGGNGEGGEDDDDPGHRSGLFNPEFLQWLVWKYDTTGYASGIGIAKLSDATMSGNLSFFGESNEVRDSRDVTKSHPIIAGMLDNRDFDELEGVFKVGEKKVDAQLYKDGRVRVMAQEDIGSATQYIRVLVTNLFLRRLLEAYLEWRSMPPEDKFVHPKYFQELHESAKDMAESATYDFDFDALVRHYAELRNEDPSDYSFEFNLE